MIVALGHQKQVGKDTVADHLIKYHDFVRCSFAAPLKELADICLKSAESDFILGLDQWCQKHPLKPSTKEIIISRKTYPKGWRDLEHGKPRRLLQWLGTDVIRNQESEDFWVDYLIDNLPTNKPVVISDVRFINEFRALKEAGAYMVKVARLGVGEDMHESEQALKACGWPYIICNDRNLPALFDQVEDLMSSLYGEEIMKGRI